MYIVCTYVRIYVYRYTAKGLAEVRLCAIRSSIQPNAHGP